MSCAKEQRGEPSTSQIRIEDREYFDCGKNTLGAMHILIHTPRAHMGSSRSQTSLYHLLHLQILFLTRVYEIPIHGSILQMTKRCPEFKLGIQKPHPVTSRAEEMTSKLFANMLMSECECVFCFYLRVFLERDEAHHCI